MLGVGTDRTGPAPDAPGGRAIRGAGRAGSRIARTFEPRAPGSVGSTEAMSVPPATVLLHDRWSVREGGRIPGAALPFYQELAFGAPHGSGLNEVEVTFLAGPHAMDVLIEGDRRGGFLDSGGDRIHRFTIGYDAVAHEDWESHVQHHLQELGRRRGLFG